MDILKFIRMEFNITVPNSMNIKVNITKIVVTMNLTIKVFLDKLYLEM